MSIAIAIIHRAKKLLGRTQENNVEPVIRKLAVIAVLLTAIQVMLGTQVREQVDQLLKNFDPQFRGDVVNYLGWPFIVHRSFSIALLLINGWLVYKVLKSRMAGTVLKAEAKKLTAVILCAFAAGVILAYCALPPAFQPIHFLLGCITFGIQFGIILKLQQEPERP